MLVLGIVLLLIGLVVLWLAPPPVDLFGKVLAAVGALVLVVWAVLLLVSAGDAAAATAIGAGLVAHDIDSRRD